MSAYIYMSETDGRDSAVLDFQILLKPVVPSFKVPQRNACTKPTFSAGPRSAEMSELGQTMGLVQAELPITEKA